MEKVEAQAVETVKEEIKQETPRETKPLSATEILKRSKTVEPTSSESSEIEELKKVNLDDIKDPVARQYAERRIKELESGVNKKFEEIAQKRKELEAKLSASNQPWTPERIQSLLKDHNFVSSVQELQKSQAPQDWSGTDEEWSSLSPSEKREFENLRRENKDTRNQVNRLLQAQEDEKLKEQYPGYDPDVVNQLQDGLMSGTVQATRADLWKVANYEKDIERAYKLGLEDRGNGLSEKINASSGLPNMQVSPTNDVPDDVRKKGIAEILKYNLSKMKK